MSNATMQRHGTGVKPQLSYILDFGHALAKVAEVMHRGHILRGYARNNWKGGGGNADLPTLLDSVMRHLEARQNGEVHDLFEKDGIGTDHLANACAGLLFALYHHGQEPLPALKEKELSLPPGEAEIVGGTYSQPLIRYNPK